MIDEPDPALELDPERIVTCWCGAEGTMAELFDFQLFSEFCGGIGVLNCYCGGDFCVCHHHGQAECPGCPDCQEWEDLGDEIPF